MRAVHRCPGARQDGAPGCLPPQRLPRVLGTMPRNQRAAAVRDLLRNVGPGRLRCMATPAGRGDVGAARALPCDECADGVADAEALATHRCDECEHLLCDQHTLNHGRSRATKGDTVTATASALTAVCLTHHGMLKLYCSTCNSAACVDCAVALHPVPAHKCQLLDDQAIGARTRLKLAAVKAERAANARRQLALSTAVAVKALLERSNPEAEAEAERFGALGEAERAAHAALMSTAAMAPQLVDPQLPDHVLVQLEPILCARLDALVAAVPATSVPRPITATLMVDNAVEPVVPRVALSNFEA